MHHLHFVVRSQTVMMAQEALDWPSHTMNMMHTSRSTAIILAQAVGMLFLSSCADMAPQADARTTAPAVAPQSEVSASTSAARIKSVADAQLRKDVMRTISAYEAAATGKRSSPPPRLIAADYVGKDGATYIERWQIESSGKMIAYRVELTPAPKGGANYKVIRLSK
ncbi:hypothetical protein [Uliginosibacterium gangwonense]|uniref:hypothetical protein n=1 Tax=Uliginosibacterium gangwonense TaxID=392736 RepID=UPI000361E054|nr:hypothetical protein [Uliginosibacterium gangwonense]